MISVIIPVYNVADFISKCLKSIQQQTFTNFEVLMIDDGSTDNSSAICQKFSDLDPRFHYYYQENAGVSSARNIGLDKATGEYIAFIDADDWIESNYLQDLYEALQNFDFAICGYKVVTDETIISRVIGKMSQVVNHRQLCSDILMNSSVYSFPWNRLYKASIIRKHQIYFDPEIRYGEDLVFNLAYCQYIDQAYILATDNYHYIQHESSASGETLGKTSPGHLKIRIEDIKAMERSLELLPSEYSESISFLKQRLVREGSVYYRLMYKYRFPRISRKQLKKKTQNHLRQYISIYTLKYHYQIVIKSWLNLTFPRIVNMIRR